MELQSSPGDGEPSELKKRLQKEISDSDFAVTNIPAIDYAVQFLTTNAKKRLDLLSAFPGVLLLGDWHDEEINLQFFERVKQDLIQRHCNAYTLDDVRKQLELRGLRVGDIEIRARGIDEAAVVLLVDGDGAGTASEATQIWENAHWNSKCIPFIKGIPSDTAEILRKKDYIAHLKQHPGYYTTSQELHTILVETGKLAADKWVLSKMTPDDQDKN
jgi:hypothetical protein